MWISIADVTACVNNLNWSSTLIHSSFVCTTKRITKKPTTISRCRTFCLFVSHFLHFNKHTLFELVCRFTWYCCVCPFLRLFLSSILLSLFSMYIYIFYYKLGATHRWATRRLACAREVNLLQTLHRVKYPATDSNATLFSCMYNYTIVCVSVCLFVVCTVFVWETVSLIASEIFKRLHDRAESASE